jgi:CRP-like cAMP-binding protein
VCAPHTISAAEGQPAVLCDIAMRAIAPDPLHRYPSIEDMAADLEAFLASGAWFVRREVAAGTDIVVEGEPASEAYLIERGRCEAYRGKGELREVLRALGPGDVFGELALITREARTASVRASEDVSLLVISSEALERQFPTGSWPRQFLDTLASRFADDEREGRKPPAR